MQLQILEEVSFTDGKIYVRGKITAVKHRQIDKSFEIYLAPYQGLSGTDEAANVYKQFSRDF